MGKRILIIGNGFDLAHGLPTGYCDFLDFSKRFKLIYTHAGKLDEYKEKHIDKWEKGNEDLKSRLIGLFNLRQIISCEKGLKKKVATLSDPDLNKMYDMLRDNIWFDYYLKLYEDNKVRGSNWIDFEWEMSEVIKWIDFNCESLEDSYSDLLDKMINNNSSFQKISSFCKFCGSSKENDYLTVERFINEKLYPDLEKLTEAINIYLWKFVENIEAERLPTILSIDPDYIISFNYTHTYQRVYRNEKTAICYIHGECKTTEEKGCNLVLGISEYLSDEDKNINTKMAIFKKFIQRIRKKNDIQYKEWLNEMGELFKGKMYIGKNGGTNGSYANQGVSDIYVYGHSLDTTDADILGLFLKPGYTSVHVYSKGCVNEGKNMCNLIKIMNEDILIEKSSGHPRKFESIVI